MFLNLDKETILKFDVAGPRYTSYPTAPNWTTKTNADIYALKLKQFGATDKTLSLYIHLPFCQTLCTFCACNVVIRREDEKYVNEYFKYLFKEIELVAKAIGKKVSVKQLHWGGGTPNFLTVEQMKQLMEKIQQHFRIDFTGEVAIEIDPRTVLQAQIKQLKTLGFNRISMGIQDFDATVQKNINRIQPYNQVEEVNRWCRNENFSSINFDLVYGLPGQNKLQFIDTIEKVLQLKPDRVALYSFAYVPWLKHHQRKIDKDTLPSNELKLDLFLEARNLFLNNGYDAIAMDHFALKTDELSKSYDSQKLYRNFMGYTVKPADEYIGLGVTSIGFLENTYIQNYKELPNYYRLLKENILPIERGKELTLDDQIRRWTINSLMCQFEVNKSSFKHEFGFPFDKYFNLEEQHLKKCQTDGLIINAPGKITITDLGKLFIRNVCMGFDWYLRQANAHKRFSKTI